ncbi:CPBP family intramembrane metalloprotease [Puteibacter caeruleilacunae]|nr:CPBP family intramembrane metalloprotease [Puteibacter caeruleilacunae]
MIKEQLIKHPMKKINNIACAIGAMIVAGTLFMRHSNHMYWFEILALGLFILAPTLIMAIKDKKVTEHRPHSKGVLTITQCLVIWFIMYIISDTIYSYHELDQQLGVQVAQLIRVIISTVIPGIALLFFMKQVHPKFDMPKFKYERFPVILVACLGILVLLFLLSSITIFFKKPSPITEIDLSVSRFIHVLVIAPFAEELIFRGIFLKELLKKYGVATSNILVAVLFAALQMDIFHAIVAFKLGLFVGWVYYKTENLALCILLHFVNNLIVLFFAYCAANNHLTEFFTFLTDNDIIISQSCLLAIAGILLVLNRWGFGDKTEIVEVAHGTT